MFEGTVTYDRLDNFPPERRGPSRNGGERPDPHRQQARGQQGSARSDGSYRSTGGYQRHANASERQQINEQHLSSSRRGQHQGSPNRYSADQQHQTHRNASPGFTDQHRVPYDQRAQHGHTNHYGTANGYDNRSDARGFRPASPGSGDASPYRDRNRYRSHAAQPKPSPRRRVVKIIVVVAAAVGLAFGGFLFAQAQPAQVTINGQNYEIGGEKTLAEAIKTSGIELQPGDLVAVDGSVLEAGKGKPFSATINGVAVEDVNKKLTSGDTIELGNGGPLEEPSDSVEEALPWTVSEEGDGAIHLIEGEGKDGVKATKTGKISGITAEQVLQEPGNIVRRNVTPDVDGDKVIALTFDDGPWGDQTSALLDALAQHGAKATFFTVGNRIEQGDGASYVKRMVREGHQVCTHSYDHASGSGKSVNLGYMTPEEQKAEIEKGYAAIEAVTGTEASRVIRAPGGNFGEDVVKNIGPLIKAEIGWNIDSRDWERPGPDAIVKQIEGAWPGAIVLMHDGGGDRSQTIEALKKALPSLKEKGYRFVTMDELMQYPLS